MEVQLYAPAFSEFRDAPADDIPNPYMTPSEIAKQNEAKSNLRGLAKVIVLFLKTHAPKNIDVFNKEATDEAMQPQESGDPHQLSLKCQAILLSIGRLLHFMQMDASLLKHESS